MKLIIAEKPSVARDLAQALGIGTKGRSYFQGDSFYITWAIGHLVTLAEPHEIQASWRTWRESDLPLLPPRWPLVVVEKTAAQFTQIKQLMERPEVDGLIAATDAGREGELIFRYIYEKAGCHKPVQRLWLSSLTPESILEGFRHLRPWSDFDRLADNARGRSRADWLVGLNFSRAYSLKYQQKWTVGRVQTPTLAMVVERTEAIRKFVPEPYAELEALFQSQEGTTYKALYSQETRPGRWEVKRFKRDDAELELLKTRAKSGEARILKREDKEHSLPPPKLFDLTELQKDANRLFGFHAKTTLDLAQSLYETHKLITYPRTDSRYLSSAIAQDLPRIVAAIRAPYETLGLHPSTGQTPLDGAYVDDSRVGDHHAIIPTGRRSKKLTVDEAKVFDLIVRRLLMAWQEPHVRSQSSLYTVIRNTSAEEVPADVYLAKGSVVLKEGWKKLDVRPSRDGTELPRLAAETLVQVLKVQQLDKETKPPLPLTDASLLNAMASAGSRLDDKELTDILRERGLGTPATRAAIIENLLQRGYIERQDKALWATPVGSALIEHVHPTVRSAALTGEWEAKLQEIEAGRLRLDAFMQDIATYVTEMIRLIQESPASALPPQLQAQEAAARSMHTHTSSEVRATRSPRSKSTSSVGTHAEDSQSSQAVSNQTRPNEIPRLASDRVAAAQADALQKQRAGASAVPFPDMVNALQNDARDFRQTGDSLRETLLKVFGHSSFRDHQEDICREIVAGHDLLLVMPTGAGKSLCYQLPAMLRPGCAIVISPLIALMDDQVGKLRSLGVPAAALHSGMGREESRAAFRDYLEGRLKLLYIAPERLGLSGFLDLLAQHPPSMIAVDEAHCISQWGHDFRPDYRMLAQRLPRLRPTPVVAMTATATPEVQQDILVQLGLVQPKLHIHGFRRKNIAIEISEVPLPERPELVRQLLRQKSHLPAIIYAPTRKETENLATLLAQTARVAPYHAGLSPDKRAQIQLDFQKGRLEAIVATIAFGMGIDKADIRTVIHTAIPSSIESYYQEIGRAGRDGKLSRAILLYSYADHRTREFFIKKNYPDVKILEAILRKIPSDGIEHATLSFGQDADVVDNALEKLWIHGAIQIQSNDVVVRLDAPNWKKAYLAQQMHKVRELELIANFAENQQECRMLQFLHHFGDRSDGRAACGICDVCLPQGSLTKDTRPPTTHERLVMQSLCSTLAQSRRGQSLSRLLSQLNDETGMERHKLDACVQALVRKGLIQLRQESFEKEGELIQYRSLQLVESPDATFDWDDISIVESYQSTEKSETPRKKASARKRSGASRQKRAGATAYDPDDALAQKLRGWRLRMARQEKVPAYRVFSDRTLAALVMERPQDETALQHIDGIGPVTYEKYGRELLKILRG